MDKDELWNQTLSLLLGNASEDDPKNFFLNQLKPVGVFGNLLVLQVQSPEVEEWVNKMYVSEIKAALQQVSGTELEVGIGNTASRSPEPAESTPAQSTFQPPSFTPPAATQTQTQATPQQPDFLNTYVTPSEIRSNTAQAQVGKPAAQREETHRDNTKSGNETLFLKCTFDNFVVGKTNEFARNAALAVAEQPGAAYNPLFIYGNSGLGKTHLLVAIANYTMQNFPGMTTRYVSANRFLDDYVVAVRNNDFSEFNIRYKNDIDILLVDDVQYLAGKDASVNELFNIFNDMTNQSKQIVLSADRAPKDIDMDVRVTSRFSSDLVVDIKPPDYETRLAILENYLMRVTNSGTFSGTIPDDVFAYLAEISTSNIREMEGAVTRLISNMELLHRDTITLDQAQELFQDLFPDNGGRQVTISTIQTEVERYFEVTHEEMVSQSRKKGIIGPRHIAIYLSRWLTEESLATIGQKFGGRDHSTVLNSVTKIEKEQKNNKILYDQLQELTIRIKEHS